MKELIFTKHCIDSGANETCAIADVDGDGVLDIVGGTHWYKGPEWVKYPMREIPFNSGYFDNFADLPLDVNGNGRVDVISGSWFRQQIAWYENPGEPGALWPEHIIDHPGNVEALCLVDIDGDGIPDILPNAFGIPVAWYKTHIGDEPHWERVDVGDEGRAHGIGYGDINGDGRIDIITPSGWYEAPPNPVEGEWKWHPEFTLKGTGIPILTYDVNDDGLTDLIWGAGHDYGLFWAEQRLKPDGSREWIQHEIDMSWSQSHALVLADLDNDGVLELITGKRYYAHGGNDPGGNEPICLYWYKLDRDSQTWTRHTLDYGEDAGGGMQIQVADINGNGKLDIVAPGKSGLYLFEQQ